MPDPTTTRERRVCRVLAREGFALRKSRLRGRPHADDLGGYRIVDADRNVVTAGSRFDSTLDDVEAMADLDS